MEHCMNAARARAPWSAADGKPGPWHCAWGCRDGVGRCSTQRHQGLWAMPVAPSCCARGQEWTLLSAEEVMEGMAWSVPTHGGTWEQKSACLLPAEDSRACSDRHSSWKQHLSYCVSPSEPRLFVQFGRQWPYCCRLSTHQLFSLCSQIASIQEAKFDSGARRVGCDLCARNAAYMTGWEGAGSPSCLCLVLCADLSQGTFAPEWEQILSSGVYTGKGHWLLWKKAMNSLHL